MVNSIFDKGSVGRQHTYEKLLKFLWGTYEKVLHDQKLGLVADERKPGHLLVVQTAAILRS